METDRLATNSMHHQGVRTVAPMLDPVAYGPDGLVEAVEVHDRSLSWGFSGTLNSLRARGKWGVFSPRLRRKLFAHILRRSMRVGVAVSISRRLPTQGRGRQWNMPMVFKRCSHIFRM